MRDYHLRVIPPDLIKFWAIIPGRLRYFSRHIWNVLTKFYKVNLKSIIINLLSLDLSEMMSLFNFFI